MFAARFRRWKTALELYLSADHTIFRRVLDRAPSRRTKHLLLQRGPNPARAVGMNGSQKPQKSKMGSFALRKLARKQSKPATLPESPTLLSAAVIRCSSSPPPPPAQQREQDPGSSGSSAVSAPSTATPPAPTARFRLGKSTPSPLGSWTPDRARARPASAGNSLEKELPQGSLPTGPLDPGWTTLPAQDGRSYFWNEATGATTWARPSTAGEGGVR